MMIKINESDNEFEKLVKELKEFTGEATAAGATKKAITYYVLYRKLYEKECKEHKKLKDNYEELCKLVREKAQIEQSIRSLTGQ